ncbi:MAG: glycosyltransferase [Desulfobulbales bacterium]|nr:glycosyltransferase [Desulfobulbales bacterium]
MDLLLVLGLVSLLLYLVVAGETLLGARRIGRLGDIAPALKPKCPPVSIIVPARNEAAAIPEALASLLALDYPGLEIIVVNDRSTDETGPLLDRIAAEHLRLEVHHLEELPSGWLGKNHALWYGASRSRGKILLFTDADVVLTPTSLGRAVNFLEQERLDHLALFFAAEVPGGLLNMMMIDFACAFMAWMKPWQARRSGSRYHIGVGAFNLVRAEGYQRCGTHRAIALEPVDDVELGRLIKENGGAQDCLFGNHSVSVKWYHSIPEMVRGLEKNIFPFCNYSLPKIAAASLAIVILRIWPLPAIFLTTGPVAVLNGLLIVIHAGLAAVAAGKSSIPLRHLIWLPVSPFIGLYILWNSTIRTIWRGGIVWRDTFYSLAELRKKH